MLAHTLLTQGSASHFHQHRQPRPLRHTKSSGYGKGLWEVFEFGHILQVGHHQRYQSLLPGSQTPECAGSWCSTTSIVLVAARALCSPRAPSSPVSGKVFAAQLLPWNPHGVSCTTNLLQVAEVSWCHGWTQGQPQPCALSSWQRLAGTQWPHTRPS